MCLTGRRGDPRRELWLCSGTLTFPDAGVPTRRNLHSEQDVEIPPFVETRFAIGGVKADAGRPRHTPTRPSPPPGLSGDPAGGHVAPRAARRLLHARPPPPLAVSFRRAGELGRPQEAPRADSGVSVASFRSRVSRRSPDPGAWQRAAHATRTHAGPLRCLPARSQPLPFDPSSPTVQGPAPSVSLIQEPRGLETGRT